jgi:site-specific recombinase XerD
MRVPASDIALLAQEWEFHLRAKNLSPATIESYTEAVGLLDAFLVGNGVTDLASVERRDIEKFIIWQSERVSPGSVLTRFRSLRVFFNWLTDDAEELERSPMARMKEPKGERKPPAVPADDDIRRMLKAISGKTFVDRRDLALLRFMFDTGCRVGEVVGLRVTDVDTKAGVAIVYGKGRKSRVVPFGAKTAQALLAYQRERRRHRLAESEMLLLGQRGPLTYNAAYRVVRERAEAVGLRLHPRQTRHWFAHSWLRDGGNEGDLRAIGGWDSNLVMRRYGASAAAERAREAHRRAAPGDRL